MTDVTTVRAGAPASVNSAAMPSPGPTFTDPPVNEVVLTVEFDTAMTVGIAAASTIRARFGDEYPQMQEQVRLPPIMASPNTTPIQFHLVDRAEFPRLWFIGEDGTRLVQFQDDRLSVNWRRQETSDPYPRYAEYIRPMMEDAWKRLQRATEDLGQPMPTPGACEIAYVNPIEQGDLWPAPGDLSHLIAPWSGQTSTDFLPTPDEVRLGSRYTLPDPGGWLAIETGPGINKITGAPVLMLQLSTRGAPADKTFEGALEFLDHGHSWIVNGFKSITTSEAHERWGLQDD